MKVARIVLCLLYFDKRKGCTTVVEKVSRFLLVNSCNDEMVKIIIQGNKNRTLMSPLSHLRLSEAGLVHVNAIIYGYKQSWGPLTNVRSLVNYMTYLTVHSTFKFQNVAVPIMTPLLLWKKNRLFILACLVKLLSTTHFYLKIFLFYCHYHYKIPSF